MSAPRIPPSNAFDRSAPSKGRNNRKPRRRRTASLRQRLILWSIVAVVLPAFTCTIAMNYLAYRGMSEAHLRSTVQLARTLAGSLEGRIGDGFGQDARSVIDGLREDARVALIAVTDADGEMLYRPISDPDAYAGLADASLEVTNATWGTGSHAQHGHYALARMPILASPETDGEDGDAAETRPTVAGYLTLGVRDTDAEEVLFTINLLQFGAASAVCLLMLPLTTLVISRWTAPLSALRTALQQLGQGQVPAPIRTATNDDLGRLCDAFNRMVQSLAQAQTQLAESNAKLENQVKQRTAELRHLNDKLEAEGNDKNEFLRAVSHDLNAPLRNIGGMAHMMLMKYKAELPDDAVSKLERIAANAKHQGELISDLLELSRLRTKEVRPEIVEMHPLMQRIIENLEYDLGQAKITLKLRGTLPTVFAEKNRIRQVLQNLLDNAIKYMMDSEERNITIAVKRTRDFEPDVFNGVDVWQFSVADTGRGIASEDVDKVFQVFARSTHSGTHVVAGRGVGLASVKTIVESYGGRIWVESTLGLGSTFTFTLPVDRVAVPESADLEEAVSDPADIEADKNRVEPAQAA
ncbi:MAG: HAMP domain-containing sensor histidine kinase [Planctomycetota bacterium]